MGDNCDYNGNGVGGSNKRHRTAISGNKIAKKRRKLASDENRSMNVNDHRGKTMNRNDEEGANPSNKATARQRNPKAFAINSAIRAERNFRRTEDLTARKQHIPVTDHTTNEPPPILIGVVGPPKVGKSTLIRSLIKNFTNIRVNDIKGPVTIVISKKRRITLVECNNDINAMIDIAKCADIILLLFDASYGYEIDSFEFLNICNVHGMPRIMGVLTHLDYIQNPEQLRKRKNEMKHRFWVEVHRGAKMFYLTGLVYDEYPRNEIRNLGRFISIIKLRPLLWRNTHSYLVIDRVEDITNTETIRQNAKCDRNIVLYGYVRGVPLKSDSMVHIAGYGDVSINEIHHLPDPCPYPNSSEKKRSLLEKERVVYAPMSGVGGIVYDRDAIYVELSGGTGPARPSTAAAAFPPQHHRRNDQESQILLEKLLQKKRPIDVQMEEQEFRVFSDGRPQKSKDFQDGIVVEPESNLDKNEHQLAMSGSKQHDASSRPAHQERTTAIIPTVVEQTDEHHIKVNNDTCDDIFDRHSDLYQIHKIDEEESDIYGDLDRYEDNSEDNSDIPTDDEESENVIDFENDRLSQDDDNNFADILESSMNWKEKAQQSCKNSMPANLATMIYGSRERSRKTSPIEETEDELLGGLFRQVLEEQDELLENRDIRNQNEESSFQDSIGKCPKISIELLIRRFLSDINFLIVPLIC